MRFRRCGCGVLVEPPSRSSLCKSQSRLPRSHVVAKPVSEETWGSARREVWQGRDEVGMPIGGAAEVAHNISNSKQFGAILVYINSSKRAAGPSG